MSLAAAASKWNRPSVIYFKFQADIVPEIAIIRRRELIVPTLAEDSGSGTPYSVCRVSTDGTYLHWEGTLLSTHKEKTERHVTKH